MKTPLSSRNGRWTFICIVVVMALLVWALISIGSTDYLRQEARFQEELSAETIDLAGTILTAGLQLPDDKGTDTTHWGSSGSWSPEVWNDGLYHVGAIGGSWNELVEGSARSCTATVSGARRKYIEMTLESIASNGLVIDAAEGR